MYIIFFTSSYFDNAAQKERISKYIYIHFPPPYTSVNIYAKNINYQLNLTLLCPHTRTVGEPFLGAPETAARCLDQQCHPADKTLLQLRPRNSMAYQAFKKRTVP